MSQEILAYKFDELPVEIYASKKAASESAASDAQVFLKNAIRERGEANLILATGNSQLDFLHTLRIAEGLDWSVITVFHMDEYLGIDPEHPASFPKFLREHIIDHVKPKVFYPVPNQPDDVAQACADYEKLLRDHPADLVVMGLGENGHIAFNDPPYADFNDPVWVKVIELDEVSRRQQVGEGHFPTLDDVPKEAITLTIPALLAPRNILAIAPETRKAKAVHACLTQPISEDRPGSILRTTAHAKLYLDRESAQLIIDS